MRVSVPCLFGGASDRMRAVHTTGARMGSYRVRRRIRATVGGTLYLARHVHTGRDVMLELVDADPGMRAQLAEETRAARQVPNRAIVDLLDQGVSEHGAWFVTERVRGESLAHRLQRRQLDAGEIARVFSQLIDIVTSFQRMTLIHGGLDVSQVLLEQTAANQLRVRLLDFGIVRKADKLFGSFAADEKAEARASAARNGLITRGVNVDVLGLGKLLLALLPRRFPRDRFAREYHYLRVAKLCTLEQHGAQLRSCEELARQFQLASVEVKAPLQPSAWMIAFWVLFALAAFGFVLSEGVRNRTPAAMEDPG